jgi:uncharacterized protein
LNVRVDPAGPKLSDCAARKRRWRHIKWSLRLVVVLVVIGYLKLVGLDGKFYYPSTEVYSRPDEFGLSHEDVSLQTSDGLTLHGWFLPAIGEPRGTVIHFHGNAANVTAHVGLIDWLPRLGYHVLMFDYRGFGQSQGRVTRAGTIRDGNAAVDYARSRPEAQNLPLFAYGQSLGGAVAIVVAAQRPELRAVVAESPFSTHRRIATCHVRRLVYFDWLAKVLATAAISAGDDPLDVVAQIAPRPLLIIAAENDEICFPELARELYDAAGEPKSFWLVPGTAHLEVTLNARTELSTRVQEFFTDAAN